MTQRAHVFMWTCAFACILGGATWGCAVSSSSPEEASRGIAIDNAVVKDNGNGTWLVSGQSDGKAISVETQKVTFDAHPQASDTLNLRMPAGIIATDDEGHPISSHCFCVVGPYYGGLGGLSESCSCYWTRVP